MKLCILFIIMMMKFSFAQANVVAGDWHGKLEIQAGFFLPLVLHLVNDEEQWQATLDSPEQGAFGINGIVDSATSTSIQLRFPTINASYSAQLKDGRLTGRFSQGGGTLPLTLTRQSEEQKDKSSLAVMRPQQPAPPFNYSVENVRFSHESQSFEFAGTLTKPFGKGPFAAAILISGSGPQDRDETILGHKPFWVLADTLTQAGIAVLRFDDRGTAQSGGEFYGTTLEEFSSDVASAFKYLREPPEIDETKIGLIGHSEGGATAPLFAAREPSVAFVVLMAGLGVKGADIWAQQQRDLAAGYGVANANEVGDFMADVAQFVIDNKSPNFIHQKMLDFGYSKANADTYTNLLANSWGKSFLSYSPDKVLPKLTMPVLAINGDKDIQVAAAPNLEGIRLLFEQAKHDDVTIKVMSGQNHLFQHAETGLPDEYGKITQTIAPETLSLISDWIVQRMEK